MEEALPKGEDAPLSIPLAAVKDDELYKCVHCGFCLSACPTYLVTGLETESPRGRIALMKAVKEGRIPVTEGVVRHWDLCIQCRACEDVCPSGVPYGNLIEATMSELYPRRRISPPARLASSLLLKRVVPSQRALGLLVGALRLYQRSGLRGLVRRTGVLRLLPGGLDALEEAAPQVPASAFHARGQLFRPRGDVRARVALLSGCIMPLVHGPEMDAVVRVLVRNGCQVVVPRGQVCCGAINSHVGDVETARQLARRNIDVFSAAGVEAVVVASAGCGARMKEYGHLLEEDREYADRARELSAKVRDVHEFLAELPMDPPQASLPYAVTYQDSCHLAHAQRLKEPPRRLLRSIPGLRLVEMEGSDVCCGAGGTYTITEREFSLRVLEAKLRSVEATGADVLATANPGCVLQLRYGVERKGLNIPVRYVTDLLDEAYRREGGP